MIKSLGRELWTWGDEAACPGQGWEDQSQGVRMSLPASQASVLITPSPSPTRPQAHLLFLLAFLRFPFSSLPSSLLCSSSSFLLCADCSFLGPLSHFALRNLKFCVTANRESTPWTIMRGGGQRCLVAENQVHLVIQ